MADVFITLFEYIKNNISWIKDIFTLIFTGTATIVAILAYKRAKATVLQPIRNEVIKKQSEILTEILNDISENENSIDQGLDYVGIAQINVYMILKEYGFILKEEFTKEQMDQIVAGWVYVGESKIIKDVEIVGIYSKDEENKKNQSEIGKQKFENAKEGIIEIDKIYITNNYKKFFKKLSEYSDNPFLPENIKLILQKIVHDVQINLEKNLKLILMKFMEEFCEKYFQGDKNPNLSPIGVYNEFNHHRIHHNFDLLRLKKEVRDYLMIDDKWY